MKSQLVVIMWDVLSMFLKMIRDWFLGPDRNKKKRMKDRETWWCYKKKAEASGNETAKMLATAAEIRFKFETPPADAKARGDLS